MAPVIIYYDTKFELILVRDATEKDKSVFEF